VGAYVIAWLFSRQTFGWSGRIVGDVDDDLIHNAHAAPVLTLHVKLVSSFAPMERRKQMDSAAVVELRRY
jgi:hypothetical protein